MGQVMIFWKKKIGCFFYNYKYRYEWGELQSFGQLLILIIFLGARSRVKCSRVPQSGRCAQGRQLLYCSLQRWGRQDRFAFAISQSYSPSSWLSSWRWPWWSSHHHHFHQYHLHCSACNNCTFLFICNIFCRDFLGPPAPDRAGKEWGILHRHSFHGEKHFCVLSNTPLTTFGKRF